MQIVKDIILILIKNQVVINKNINHMKKKQIIMIIIQIKKDIILLNFKSDKSKDRCNEEQPNNNNNSNHERYNTNINWVIINLMIDLQIKRKSK